MLTFKTQVVSYIQSVDSPNVLIIIELRPKKENGLISVHNSFLRVGIGRIFFLIFLKLLNHLFLRTDFWLDV